MDRWTRFIEWCQRPNMIELRTHNPRNAVVLVTFSLLLVTSILLGVWNYQVAFVPPAEYPFIPARAQPTPTSLTLAVPSPPQGIPFSSECTVEATLKDENDNPLQNFDIDFFWTHKIMDTDADCVHWIGTTTTDSNGEASLTYTFDYCDMRARTYANFNGTTTYAPSGSEYVDIVIIDYTPFLGGGGILAVASIVGYIVFRRRKKMSIEILKLLSHRPGSVREVLRELHNRGFTIRYRDSVYRALENLTVAGFLEKYYAKEDGGIRYRVLGNKIRSRSQ